MQKKHKVKMLIKALIDYYCSLWFFKNYDTFFGFCHYLKGSGITPYQLGLHHGHNILYGDHKYINTSYWVKPGNNIQRRKMLWLALAIALIQ